MIDIEFCDLLEIKIEGALANSDKEPVKYYCCDGVLLPTFEHEYSPKYVNDNRQIVMTAFVGRDGQDKYELTLCFGRKALSRYARGLDIAECVPDPESSDWFEIDITERKIWVFLD
jgi:hypothetical protein